MKPHETAYFVWKPRTIQDLEQLHLLAEERAYLMMREIELSAMDYENFTTDLLADREFLENLDAICAEGTPMRCLFVHARGKQDGVLVIPDSERNGFVRWAAYKSSVKKERTETTPWDFQTH